MLEGKARFTVGKGAPFDAEIDDAVVIPCGVRYSFLGNPTYLVINSPAFVEGDDIYDEVR